MDHNRIEIGDNIGFSTIIDKKFKSSLLTVRFITSLDKQTSSDNVMAFSLLSDTNSRYRTIAGLSEALSELYGSSISSFSRKRGDLQILGISSTWLASRYAIYGEDIQKGMLEIFHDCLFSPDAENGAFNSETFAIEKKELLDRIDAELNSKRRFAVAKGTALSFSGEPAENYSYGTKETAEAVTSESAYSAYRRILETARIEAFFVSSEPDPNVEKMLRDGFASVKRRPEPVRFISYSPLKPEPVTVTEEFDVRQCKMVMAFKTDSEDAFALRLMATILGVTPVSKLFVNVREKLGLCYYCSCQIMLTKGTLFIDCGVDRDNIEKARQEIMRQIDEMCSGNITDDEISSAVLATENGLCQVGDTISSYSGWYFERLCENSIQSPQEMEKVYRGVTKERIVEAAKTLKLDSVYIMLDKEDKE